MLVYVSYPPGMYGEARRGVRVILAEEFLWQEGQVSLEARLALQAGGCEPVIA